MVINEESDSNTILESGLIASQHISSEDLKRLMDQIRSESCSHSWKNFQGELSEGQLLEWEKQLRPTTVFYYYVQSENGALLVAAATVADKINGHTTCQGLPVLGRCYVVPEFRNNGYYREVVQHRLSFCQKRFGHRLKAVHIGTNNKFVSQCITSNTLTFSHIGQEALNINDHVHVVDAYLMIMPDYLNRLIESVPKAEEDDSTTALYNSLINIQKQAPSFNLASGIRQAYQSALNEGWRNQYAEQEIENLMTFFSEIPLIGFEKQ